MIDRSPLVLIVMGVSGSGKTTVGRLAAERIGCRFEDADRFHPAENIVKMSHGEPLNDMDRWRWLDALRNFIHFAVDQGERTIIACSALSAAYRLRLKPAATPHTVQFVYLHISREAVQARLEARRGHFMPAALLDSQFADLEEPLDAQWLDAERPAEELALAIQELNYNIGTVS